MGKTTARTEGVHHVGLTVLHLADSVDFFVRALGFQVIGELAEYPAVFVSDGTVVITLWQVYDPQTAVAFDRKSVVGLHHLAFKVGSHAALDRLYEDLLRSTAAAFEFGPQWLGDGPARHMMTRIPGDIRIEFFSGGESTQPANQ